MTKTLLGSVRSVGARVVAALAALTLVMGATSAAAVSSWQAPAAQAATVPVKLIQVLGKMDSLWILNGSDSEMRLEYQIEVPKGAGIQSFAYNFNGSRNPDGGTPSAVSQQQLAGPNLNVGEVNNGQYRIIRRDNFGDRDRLTISMQGDLGGIFDQNPTACPYSNGYVATRMTVAGQSLNFVYRIRIFGGNTSTCSAPGTAKPSLTIAYDDIFNVGNSQRNFGYVVSDSLNNGVAPAKIHLVNFMSPLKDRTNVGGQCTNVTKFYYQWFRSDGTVADQIAGNSSPREMSIIPTSNWSDGSWSQWLTQGKTKDVGPTDFKPEGPGYYKLYVWPIATNPDGTETCSNISYFRDSIGKITDENAFFAGSVHYLGGKPAAEVTKSFHPKVVSSAYPRNTLALGSDATVRFTIDAGASENGTGQRFSGVGFTDTLPANLQFTDIVSDSCGFADKQIRPQDITSNLTKVSAGPILQLSSDRKTITLQGETYFDLDAGTAEAAGAVLPKDTTCTIEVGVTHTSAVTGRSLCPNAAQTNDSSNVTYYSLNTVIGPDEELKNPTQSDFGECLNIDAISDIAVEDVTVNLAPGQTKPVTFPVKNLSGSPATNVAVSIKAPTGTSFTGTAPAGCTLTASNLTCTIAGPLKALPDASGTHNVQANLKADASASEGTVQNDISAAAGTPVAYTDPVTSNNDGKLTVIIGTAEYDLAVADKSNQANPIVPGGTGATSFTVTNNGPSNASGVVASYTAPDGVTITSVTDSALAARCVIAADATSVQCSGLALAVDQTITVPLAVKVAAAAAPNATLTKADGVQTPSGDTAPANDKADAKIYTASPSADLGVSFTAPAAKLVPGVARSASLVVTNYGPSDAPASSLTWPVPTDITVTNVPSGCSLNAGTLECTVPALSAAGAGAAKTFTFSVAVDASYDKAITTDQTITGTASIATTFSQGADTHANTTPTPIVVTQGQADLEHTKTAALLDTDADRGLSPGEDYTYTVTVWNNGPSSATDVHVTDALPNGLTFVSGTGCTGSSGNKTVTCGPIDTLPAGKANQVAYTFTVHLDASFNGTADDLRNSAKTTTDTDPIDDPTHDPEPTDPPNYIGPRTDVTYRKTAQLLGGATKLSPGQQFEYSIEAYNLGPSDARAVTVSDLLPKGLTYVGSTDGCGVAKDSSTGRDFVTCPPIATLPAVAAPGIGDPKNVTYTFKVLLADDYEGDGSDLGNVAIVRPGPSTPEKTDPTDDPGPVFPPNPQAEAKIKHDKTASNLPDNTDGLNPGEEFYYTIKVWNEGPSQARNVSVTDTLPPDVSWVGPVTGTCAATGQNVTCGPIDKLAVGAKDSPAMQTYTFKVKLAASYTGTGSDATVLNTATTSSDTPITPTDPPPATPLPDYAGPVSDLEKTKTANVLPDDADGKLMPGEKFTYTITVKNWGPSDAPNVTISDQLPAGVSFVPTAGDTCSASGQLVTCPTVLDMKVGQSVSHTFTALLASDYDEGADGADNVAAISSGNPEPKPDPHPDPKPTPLPDYLDPVADLAKSKTAAMPADLDTNGDGKLSPGEQFTYTISVKNFGPSAAKQVEITDALPGGVTFVSSSDGCTADATNKFVTCPSSTKLDANETVSYTFRVLLDKGFTGTKASDALNTATITSDTPEPKPDPHPDPAPTPLPDYVGPIAHLVKAKSVKLPDTDEDGKLSPGEDVIYTISVTNNGPSIAQSVSVSDDLPTGLTFVSSATGCQATDAAKTKVTCGSAAPLDVTGSLSYSFQAHLDSGYAGSKEALKNVAVVDTTTPDPDDDGDPEVVPEDYIGPRTDVTYRKVATQPAELDRNGDGKLNPGEDFEYAITVYNLGPSDAKAVTVSDLLPEHIAFTSSATGCTATKDEDSGRDKVTCPDIETLKPGGPTSDAAVTYTFTVTLDAAYDSDGKDLGNTVQVAPSDETPEKEDPTDDPGPVLPPDSSAQAKVEHAKTAATIGDTKLHPGEEFTYTIEVWNTGPSVARDVLVHDKLPQFVSYVEPVTGACMASGQDVTCGPIATLAVGAKGSEKAEKYTFKVKLSEDYTGLGDEDEILNHATETSSTPLTPVTPPDGTPLPDYDGPRAAIERTKTASLPKELDANGDGVLSPGEKFQYTIAAKNTGPSRATNLTFRDELPDGVTFDSSTACSADEAKKVVTCPAVDSLAVGASVSYTFIALLDASYDAGPAGANNTAQIGSATPDPDGEKNDGGTNEEPLPEYFGPVAELERTKTASLADGDADGVLSPGEQFQYTISVRNAGPSDAKDVAIVDPLPDGVTFVSSADGCTAAPDKHDVANKVVTCPTIETLANGATASATFTVLLDADFRGTKVDATNTATVTSKTPSDPDKDKDDNGGGTTNPEDLPDDPSPKADVTYVKTTAQPVEFDSNKDGKLNPGEKYQYTIEAINHGPSTAEDVTVTDLLPAGLTFVAPDTEHPSRCTGKVSPDPAHAGRTLVTCPTIAKLGVDVKDDGRPRTASVSYTFTVLLDEAFTGSREDLGNVADVKAGPTTPLPDDPTDPPGPVLPPDPAGRALVKYEKTAHVFETAAKAGQVAPGEEFAYTITVWNAGPSAASNVQVKDALPEHVSFVAPITGACASADGTNVVCGPIKHLAVGAKDSGVAQSYTFKVRLDADYRGTGTEDAICNYASFESDTELAADPDVQCAALPAFAGPLTDVTYTKTAKSLRKDGKITPGEDFQYTITALNYGPSTAEDVTVTDLLPAHLTFVKSDDGCTAIVSSAPGDAGRTLVTCPAIARLGVDVKGEKATAGVPYTFTVHLDAAYKGDGKDLGNTAKVTPGPNTPEVPNPTEDPNPTYPPAIENKPVLDIVKTASTDEPQPGQKVTYTVTMTNTGTGFFDPATMTDDMSDVLDDATYNSDAKAVATPTVGDLPQPKLDGDTMTWSGPIGHGHKVTITYSVRVMDEPAGNLKLRNSVTSDDVGSTCPSGTTNPRCGTGQGDTGGIPRLEISDVATPDTIRVGELSTLKVTVVNTGKGTYRGAHLADEFEDASATEFAGHQRASSGALRIGSIIWDGDVKAGQAVTITFDVRGTKPGASTYHMLPSSGGTNCPTATADKRCATTVTVIAADQALPHTGAMIAGEIAAGVGLLGIGLLLWFLAKRRRREREEASA